MRYKLSIRYIAFSIALLLSFNAFAISCNEQSAQFLKEGGSYFDYKLPQQLTNQQKSGISTLFRPFSGKNLKGSSSLLECLGPVSNSRKKSTFETANAELRAFSDGKITIYFKLYNKKTKTGHTKRLELFGHKSPYQIIQLTNNRLILKYNHRQKNIFFEENINFTFTRKTLTMNSIHYINGTFAYQETRVLSL